MLLCVKMIAAILCAVGGSLAACRYIDTLYQQKRDILSFPQQTGFQALQRRRYLPAVLGILFAFCLLNFEFDFFVIVLTLLFIYFLVIFTITDWEQQVIFDITLLPFSLLGLIFCLVTGADLAAHLLAALGGGFLFLLLAVLTRGGIGGGDIKLIAALGLWLGVDALVEVVAWGFIAGGIGAFFLLKFRHKKKTDTFAYGPFFTIAALLQLFLQ